MDSQSDNLHTAWFTRWPCCVDSCTFTATATAAVSLNFPAPADDAVQH